MNTMIIKKGDNVMASRREKLMSCLNSFPRMTVDERKAIEAKIKERKKDGTFTINTCAELINVLTDMRFRYRYQPMESMRYV